MTYSIQYDHMHSHDAHKISVCTRYQQLVRMILLFFCSISLDNTKSLAVFLVFSPKVTLSCRIKSPSQRKREQQLMGLLHKAHLRGRWQECKNEDGSNGNRGPKVFTNPQSE